MSVGTRIKARRIQLGLSQDELAKKMGYKDRSTINKIESGVNDITQSKVKQFAYALNTTIAYLMEWIEDPSPRVDLKSAKEDFTPYVYDEDGAENPKIDDDSVKAMALWGKYSSLSPQKQEELDRFLEFLRSQP